MSLTWRLATPEDSPTLAEWNAGLIQDEGHRNAMTVSALAQRMQAWLRQDYRAVIFAAADGPVGYALYRAEPEPLYLRQFYIRPGQRRRGYGREGVRLLREEIWPREVRLTVDVLSGNAAGIAFWRAMGYRDYCLTLEILPGKDAREISRP